jgi:hypothetical protein
MKTIDKLFETETNNTETVANAVKSQLADTDLLDSDVPPETYIDLPQPGEKKTGSAGSQGAEERAIASIEKMKQFFLASV